MLLYVAIFLGLRRWSVTTQVQKSWRMTCLSPKMSTRRLLKPCVNLGLQAGGLQQTEFSPLPLLQTEPFSLSTLPHGMGLREVDCRALSGIPLGKIGGL